MQFRRLRFFIWFLALAAAAALLDLPGRNAFGVHPSTPAYPDLFMRGAAREDLTRVANKLLGLRYGSIVTPPDGPTATTMSPGSPPNQVPEEIDSVLRRHGFKYTDVKASDSAVVFVSVQGRAAYRYTYSARSLGPPYTAPSTLSEADFSDWAELERIARFGLDTSECARNRIVFEPTIVYPYLQKTLGDSQLSAIASKRSPTDITPSEKLAVLTALNEQRLSRSRLIEDHGITYDPGNRFGLALGPHRVSSVFWAVRLLDTLVKAGAIHFAPDHRHVRVQDNLSADNERRVEWLHVGLMSFLYGNLFEKPDPGYDMDLGGGWYFRRD